MTSGKYRVFSVPPQMSWQETGFSQSKGKSARKCISVDSPGSQLLSGDRKETVGTLRALCNPTGTEGTAPDHRKPSVKMEMMPHHAVHSILYANSEGPTSDLGSATHELCVPEHKT